MGECAPLEPWLQTCTGPWCLLKSITPRLSLCFISCLLLDLRMFKNSKAVSFFFRPDAFVWFVSAGFLVKNRSRSGFLDSRCLGECLLKLSRIRVKLQTGFSSPSPQIVLKPPSAYGFLPIFVKLLRPHRFRSEQTGQLILKMDASHPCHTYICSLPPTLPAPSPPFSSCPSTS